MRFLTWLGCSALSLFCLSCAVEKIGNVNPDTVRQVHEATYDAEKDTTSVVSNLLVGSGGIGGTELDLEGSSASLSDNGVVLKKDATVGADYRTSFKGLVDKHAFKYVDIHGKAYENRLVLPKIEWADFPSVLHRKDQTTVHFAGEPLAAGERIFLEFNAGSKIISASAVSVGDSSITLSEKDYRDLPAGEIKVRWQREKTTDLTHATPRGGNEVGRYLTKIRTITLVD